MKQHLQTLLTIAIQQLQQEAILPQDLSVEVQVERARDRQFGDYASSIALILAKAAKLSPRILAEKIIALIPTGEQIAKIEIAGPGFINFFLTDTAFHQVVSKILKEGSHFGRNSFGKNKKILLEFVSSNPTGPLHVGHGRSAAFGASLANLLEANGYDVHREYYVNDAGRQMDILAVSVWLRYLQLFGESFTFPSNAYQGEYIKKIAEDLKKIHDKEFYHSTNEVYVDIPLDEPDGGDKEKHIDALIARAKNLLGEAAFRIVHSSGLNNILADIREDLAEFGVLFQTWYSERSLMERGAVEHALQKLRDKNYLYEQDGAIWFKSRDFGDERDRVVIRANGNTTYFASDVAYHLDKYEREFDQVIDIFGADHHGYIVRTTASISALGYDPANFKVLLVQFAILFRGEERVKMSTRSGSFVTLRELREEVGNDAARFFYVMRKADQHMDFDLELAKSQSADNPVYYIQYAHARICSIFRQLAEKKLTWDAAQGNAGLSLLNTEQEKELLAELARYPEMIAVAGQAYEPHQLTHYLRELAHCFHTYYNAHQFIVEDTQLRQARLNLIAAVKQVLVNGLTIIGVSTPEAM